MPTWQVSSNDSQRMTQVTAWDRDGLTATSPGYSPDYEEICTYGSSYKQAATAFSKNTVTTSLVATDLTERTTYIPTSSLASMTDNSLSRETYNFFKPVFMIGI